MTAKFEYLANPSPRALVISLSRGEARHTVAFENAMTHHPKIGDAVTALQVGVANVAEHLNKVAPDRSDEGLNKEARSQVDRLKTPFKMSVEAAHSASASAEKAWQDTHTPNFDKDAAPAVRAELRTFAAGLTLAKKIEAADSDPLLAAAMVEGGPARSGLPADVYDRIRRNMAIGQLTERLAQRHDFRINPTADDPIGGRPDKAAARNAAEAQIADLEAERELLGRVPGLLASVVTAVALATGETRQAAFERLSK